jgi:tetratricopeptide (TPR) repeat protein
MDGARRLAMRHDANGRGGTRLLIAAAVAFAVVAPAHAALSGTAPNASAPNAIGMPHPGQSRYEACLAQTHSNPQQAFEAALEWESDGGDGPAQHCKALALVALKQYGEAAMQLQGLANETSSGPASVRADLLDQAANAWILANQPKNAISVLDAALKLSPDKAELFVDRARASAMGKDWASAIRDLSTALSLDPEREEAYVFRASALRQAGEPKRALEDIDTALALDGRDPDALLERGAIHLALGDEAAARKAWLRASEVAPDSPAAKAARANLQSLALGRDRAKPPS